MSNEMPDAEVDDFGDPITSEEVDTVNTTEIEELPSGGTKVGFEFPPGTDPTIIAEAMRHVGKITADRMKAKSLMDISKEEYKKNGHRRWKCQVNSLRKKYNIFELYIEHPDTGKPVKVQGTCGVRLERGLTMFAIRALQNSYHMETEEIPQEEQDPRASMAVTYRTRKVPNYTVEIYEEIQNPPRVGSIGKRKNETVQPIG